MCHVFWVKGGKLFVFTSGIIYATVLMRCHHVTVISMFIDDEITD